MFYLFISVYAFLLTASFLLPPHCIYKINCFYRKALEKQFHNEIGRLPKIVLYHIFINGRQALARYIFVTFTSAFQTLNFSSHRSGCAVRVKVSTTKLGKHSRVNSLNDIWRRIPECVAYAAVCFHVPMIWVLLLDFNF